MERKPLSHNVVLKFYKLVQYFSNEREPQDSGAGVRPRCRHQVPGGELALPPRGLQGRLLAADGYSLEVPNFARDVAVSGV